MTDAKMGGKPNLVILAIGGQDLTDILANRQDGGSKLDKGLRDRVAERFDGEFKVALRSQPGATMRDLANWVATEASDIVLVSTLADVTGIGQIEVSRLHEEGQTAMKALKASGAHVIVFNVSTFDPSDTVTNYHGLEHDTPALRAHKVALTLIDLSAEQGISIVDADRLLAEMGAQRHVESIGRYSSEATEVLCEEVLRVITDYGFFEERPLMVQAGRGA